LTIGNKSILLSDVVAGVLYILVGITFSLLALTGKITMGMEQPLESSLGVFWGIVRWLRAIPGSEFLFLALLSIGIFFLFKKGKKS